MKKSYLSLLLLFLLSALAALIGLSFSYPSSFTPKSHQFFFERIAPDGWIEDGGRISLPYLFSRGNQLKLKLGGWRPGGQPPAEIEISVCGELVQSVVVDGPSTVDLFLTGACTPRQVTYKVLNPFKGTPTDPRELGTELKGVELTSRLGFPLLQPWVYLTFSAGFFLLILAVKAAFHGSGAVVIGTGVLLGSTVLLALSGLDDWMKLVSVWMVVFLLLLGCWLSERVPETGPVPSAIHPRDKRYFLFFIIVLGALLRFYGIHFGLPMNFHPDEVPKSYAIERMVSSGTLNPQYFLHPTLLLYSTYFFNWVLHTVGIFSGDFLDSIFLSGRLVSAVAGTLSIPLVYGIGRLLFRPSIGLTGALLFAAFPLSVTSSRYLKEDSLLLFFVLLCVYFTVRASAQKKPQLLLLAGIAAGCSASVKYSGALSGIIPFGAAWLASGGLRPDFRYIRWACLGSLLVPAAFVACSPYVLLDYEKFLTDFNYERKHMVKGHTAVITAWSQYWTYHISRSLWSGMTAVPLWLALVGVGVAFRRFWNPMLFLTALFLLFYLPAEFVKAKPAPQPERYIVPCLPFLALLAACTLWLLQHGSRRTSIAIVLFFVVTALPLGRSAMLTFEVPHDTRLKMKEWISQNLSCGSKIYIDHKRYSPELDQECYQVTHAPRANIPRDLDLVDLQQKEQEYLLLSSLWYDRYFSQPNADQRVAGKIRRLQRELEVVHEEAPLFGTYGFNNPTVTLYRIPS